MSAVISRAVFVTVLLLSLPIIAQGPQQSRNQAAHSHSEVTITDQLTNIYTFHIERLPSLWGSPVLVASGTTTLERAEGHTVNNEEQYVRIALQHKLELMKSDSASELPRGFQLLVNQGREEYTTYYWAPSGEVTVSASYVHKSERKNVHEPVTLSNTYLPFWLWIGKQSEAFMVSQLQQPHFLFDFYTQHRTRVRLTSYRRCTLPQQLQIEEADHYACHILRPDYGWLYRVFGMIWVSVASDQSAPID
ncbi:MAG: hypothetical protein ACR2PX_13820 [Endozoicomonas sp.]|uniref:hypothetical protein n=1 Tax=Endozoicomonas sp. TaxID=1892382 RepID=UPI003D9BE274